MNVAVSKRLWNRDQTEAINWRGPGLYAPHQEYDTNGQWTEHYAVESEVHARQMRLGTPSEWTEQDIAGFS